MTLYRDTELPEIFSQLLQTLNHEEKIEDSPKVSIKRKKNTRPKGEICDIVTKHFDPNDPTHLLYSECLVYDEEKDTWTSRNKPEESACTESVELPVEEEVEEEVEVEEVEVEKQSWFRDSELPARFTKLLLASIK